MWQTLNHQAYKQNPSNLQLKKPQTPKPISKSKQKSKSKSNYASGHKKQNNLNKSTSWIKKQNNMEQYGVKLVKKLENHREKLSKKLDIYTLLFSNHGNNKCLKHDCTISAYDSAAKQLLCAACLTQKMTSPASSLQSNKQKSFKQQKLSSSKRTIKNSTKFSCLPLQKSTFQLQSHINQLKFEIIKQLQTLKDIQNILYTGFQEQRVQLQFGIRNVQNMFDIVVKDMNIAKEKAKCMLIQKYSQEKIKHQFVIKELGLLRLLTQDYLQSLNKNLQQNMDATPLVIIKLNNKQQSPYRQLNKSRTQSIIPTAQYSPIFPSSPSKNSKYQQQQWPTQTLIQSNSNNNSKFLVYQHLILKQLAESLRFGKSGHAWTQQKHVNNIQVRAKQLMQNLRNVRNVIKQQFINF